MREALGLGTRRDAPVSRQTAEPQRQSGHRPSGDRPSSTGHRHRFVQDGEVPVVMVNHAGGNGSPPAVSRPGDIRLAANRAAAMAADVGAERSARERAEKSLQQALANIRDLETKLAHAELARIEAVESVRSSKLALATTKTECEAAVAHANAVMEAERTARQECERALEHALAAVERAARTPPRAALGESQDVPARHIADAVVETAPKAPRQRAAKGETTARVAKRSAAEPKPVKWWVPSKTTAKR
jgi:hypothetical protein